MRQSWLLGLVFAASTAWAGQRLHLQSGSFDPTTQAAARSSGLPSSRYGLVQLHRASDPALRSRLEGVLGPIQGYLPEDTYLFQAKAAQLFQVAAWPEVRWTGPFLPDYKLSPALRSAARGSSTGSKLVAVFPHCAEDPRRVAQKAARLGCEVLRIRTDATSHRLLLQAPPAALQKLAQEESISWIEEVQAPTTRNANTAWVVQSNRNATYPLWDRGLHGEGQIVGHIDYALDLTHCMLKDSIPPGPNHTKVVAYRVDAGSAAHEHGTHTSATIAGRRLQGLGSPGMAYESRLSHTDLRRIVGFGAQNSNLDELLMAAHQDGARIHSNSWGDDTSIAYNALARDIDVFSHQNEEDLVVFAVSNLSALRSPENAKSVLAVGATSAPPSQGGICSGGTGPTVDGRRKPEVFVPGCNVVSASVRTFCGLTAKTGTSMACAATAGAAALVRQYFTEGFYPSGQRNAQHSLTPSGALLRALLIQSSQDMSGEAGYPTDQEGWGRLLLDSVLPFASDPEKLLLRDVRNADGLGTEESTQLCFEVLSDDVPLRVTMAFTDVPAELHSTDAVVNDLDLELEGPGGTYRGNHFVEGQSAMGGEADPRNSAENILLRAPQPGRYTVRIRGTAVRLAKQGFGLVISGDVQELPPLEAPQGLTATPVEDHQIRVEWDAVPGAERYLVSRSSLGCAGPMHSIGIYDSLEILDPNLSGQVDYAYQVQALPADCSAPGLKSVCIEAQTTGACTLGPSFTGANSVQSADVPNCALALDWDAAHAYCGSEVRYNVYRSAEAEFQPTSQNLIFACLDDLGFVDRYALDSGVPQFYIVRTEDLALPGNGPCGGTEDANLHRLSSAPHGPGTIESTWLETFEHDAPGWEADGLWHSVESSSCVPPGYSSSSHAWYFGQDSDCTYATGAAVEGKLVSPWIGPLSSTSSLTFDYFRQVESFPGNNSVDAAIVSIETQGETPQEVWRRSAVEDSESQWTESEPIALGAWSGRKVRLRFAFRSGDSEQNAFKGWAIDDVQVDGIVQPAACQRAEYPEPLLIGALLSGQEQVEVQFALPPLGPVLVYSGTELLGTAASRGDGGAQITLNRALTASDRIHAEASGRSGPARQVFDPRTLDAEPSRLVVMVFLAWAIAAVVGRKRRRRV